MEAGDEFRDLTRSEFTFCSKVCEDQVNDGASLGVLIGFYQVFGGLGALYIFYFVKKPDAVDDAA